MSALPRLVKPARGQGAWTAELDGERLGVLHNMWWTKPSDYHDPMDGTNFDGKKHQTLVEALKATDKVLVQKTETDGSFRSLGYIGLFRFTDLVIADDGAISLKIVERLPARF